LSRRLNAAVGQLGPIHLADSRASVVRRLIAMLREAHGRGARFVVFPELALTTFFPRWWMTDQAEIDRFFEREMPNPETRPLFELARDLGIGDSVQFAGAVSPEELNVCYDRCCIFAMPARTDLDERAPRGEGFGIVFLEAMAHGKPVVGPRVGAPAEFIRSGEHGLLVDPVNPGEIAAALVELLEDPARARRMGAAGKEWVAREFSFDRFCERLRDALQT